MLNDMRGKMNEMLGCGALALVFFLMCVGFGRDEFTVNVGYVGVVMSVVFIAVVGWRGLLATRPDK